MFHSGGPVRGGGRVAGGAPSRLPLDSQLPPAEDPLVKYTQHNPLPLPESGPSTAVTSTLDTIFDWQYALKQQNLLALYEKGKAATWNASDLDWSIDVDMPSLKRGRSLLLR